MTVSKRMWRHGAVAWTAGIGVTVFLPGSFVPETGLFEYDKLIHFGLFVGFALLWLHAARGPRRRAVIWILLLGLAYAVLTEVGQEAMQLGRRGDPYDAVANAAGLVAGLVAGHMVHREPADSA